MRLLLVQELLNAPQPINGLIRGRHFFTLLAGAKHLGYEAHLQLCGNRFLGMGSQEFFRAADSVRKQKEKSLGRSATEPRQSHSPIRDKRRKKEIKGENTIGLGILTFQLSPSLDVTYTHYTYLDKFLPVPNQFNSPAELEDSLLSFTSPKKSPTWINLS
ncbi:unnamed protein product [Lepeophtheirus salmonis]|uniref:(salmon louse) hypothetical protein n=1 Tax=Lepeophtheirus salmonis TaxID=72036 RepID=A0A7R8CZC6_LEPSM|nr:unnamed protein product [Lepeophtheirus salmonis]CAF2932011.1 unnamed protein product [Lepeophtheirus salmonis]